MRTIQEEEEHKDIDIGKSSVNKLDKNVDVLHPIGVIRRLLFFKTVCLLNVSVKNFDSKLPNCCPLFFRFFIFINIVHKNLCFRINSYWQRIKRFGKKNRLFSTYFIKNLSIL